MSVITFDPATFRLEFPAFADATLYPDPMITLWWNLGTDFISKYDTRSNMLRGESRRYALDLLAAHVGQLSILAASGQQAGFVKEAHIDKIGVQVQPPPDAGQFVWWLNQTPYGAQLAALLTLKAVGGLYVGGLPERLAFRRVGGGFGGIPPRAIR